MKIVRIETMRVFVPYNPPLGPYRGRSGETQGAGSVIVRVETEDGLVGWGEGGGRFAVDPDELLRGQEASDIERALELMEKAGIAAYPMSGVEMALWDIIGKAAGLPVCRLLGGVCHEEVELCACMGIKAPEASAETARIYIERWGFTTLKTKAGRDVEEDLRIARAIQEAVGDRAVLRPDANAGYTPEEAERAVRGMKEIGGIQYFEDPCACEHLSALARFRRDIGLPIAVNMGIGKPASVVPIAQAGAADVVMPDTAAGGGIWVVKKVAAAAEAVGLPCVMHCSHDLGLKTAAVAHVAASTPNFTLGNDTTYHGLSDDILTEPFTIRNGKIKVPLEPGLGVEVDEEKVRRYRVEG